jgi:hypothetical protein
MSSKKDKLEITELFMAKAGKHSWDRCFYGTIKRETRADGNTIVYGKIKVLDGFVCAMAATQEKLGDRLDELVLMVLDYGLYDGIKLSTIILETELFLN